MTVIRPNSISGVSSITAQGGSINVHRADGTVGDLTINNIVGAAATFSGVVSYEDVTNVDSVGVITARAGINVTGGVITGNLTGTASTSTNAATAYAIDSAASLNTSGIVTATTFNYTGSQNLSNRNIIINGAMEVAQRGTSSTVSGYGSVDRMTVTYSGLDEAPTQAQVDVASGTTPYSLGFRKAFKITNGNQTSGADANDYISFSTRIEAQDMSSCGWNYTSTSSYITLSFWIKSSVAQSFHGYIDVLDGTRHIYPFETGALTADTWTKITKVIPGNSNLQFDNDATNGKELGLMFIMWPMLGTNYTDNSVSFNSWIPYVSSARFADVTTTWYTTNDSTLEYTGIQLEVGPVATPFEHRSYADELRRCQRYYEIVGGAVRAFDYSNYIGVGAPFKVTKRAIPTNTMVHDGLISGASFQTFITSGMTDEIQLEGCYPQWSSASGGYVYGFKITSDAEL